MGRRARGRRLRSGGARRGALLGLDVVLLADGLVGHGGRAAAPLLAVGALAAEVLRHGRHPRRRAGSPRRHRRGEGDLGFGGIGKRGGGCRANNGGGGGGRLVGFKWWLGLLLGRL